MVSLTSYEISLLGSNVDDFNLLSNIIKTDASFFVTHVTSNEVTEAINGLNNSKCLDEYGLHSDVMKDRYRYHIFSRTLNNLFNRCRRN